MTNLLQELLDNHRGKAIGLLLGLFLALLILTFGFWRSAFILICMVLGYIIGKRIDEKARFREIYSSFVDRVKRN